MENKVVDSDEDCLKFEVSGVDKRTLFGYKSEYLRRVEMEFSVKIVARGNKVKIYGSDEKVKKVKELFDHLIEYVTIHGNLPEYVVDNSINKTQDEEQLEVHKGDNRILVTANNETIEPKTPGQRRYLNAMENNDIVFVIGPAGTGKTYLSVAYAVRRLKERIIDRLILVRPAVEAGEELGFLPGDMREKVDPYLRPLFDALYDMLPKSKVERAISDGTIEVAPLAFMRGRSLNNAFIIVDESQNITLDQMKMLLTRLGNNSYAVVTGDITQIDLQHKRNSGLVQSQDILKGFEDIAFVYLQKEDVVRHKVVKKIIQAFQEYENDEKKNS